MMASSCRINNAFLSGQQSRQERFAQLERKGERNVEEED